MHRSRLSTFVIDCQTPDLDRAAEFWGRALGRPWRPDPDTDPSYRVIDSDVDEPLLLVQKVEHPSRIHLDIEADDLEAEARRLSGDPVHRGTGWPNGSENCVALPTACAATPTCACVLANSAQPGCSCTMVGPQVLLTCVRP